MITLQELHNRIDEQDYIESPANFVYCDELQLPDNIELNEEHIMDILNHIAEHNKECVDKIKYKNEKITKLINQDEKQKEEQQTKTEQAVIKREYKDVDSKLDILLYSYGEDDYEKTLLSIPTHEIIHIKLAILKKINELKKQIKLELIYNPLFNISNIQEEIDVYGKILSSFDLLTNKEEIIEEENDSYNPNIIFLKNKDTSYIYEDLSECIEENKEIKKGFNKVLSGYFLTTKDLTPIRNYDKMYEYKNPNGLRVLYFVLPNNYVAISKIFLKDKNRSKKISSNYEDAYQRFIQQKEYIINNLNNPDFLIDQSLLVGELVTLIEDGIILKKVGD